MTSEFISALTDKQLRERIAAKERWIAAIEVEYGKGVRPDWVGEDIGSELIWINRYQQELDQRKGDSK